MIGKVKKWLGIEGVKLELVVAETYDRDAGVISGIINLTSMNPQKVTELRVRVVEKYTRGWRKEKRIDEYTLGSLKEMVEIDVPANEAVEVEFSLPFHFKPSEMDYFGDQNFLFKGLSKMAKSAYAVKSEFRVEAEATVKGVALDPFDKKPIKFK